MRSSLGSTMREESVPVTVPAICTPRVADPASHLLIGASAAGDDRDPELGKDLAGADDCLVRPGVEVPGLYRPGPGQTVDHHRGLQGCECGGEVLRRVGLAQRAADCAH